MRQEVCGDCEQRKPKFRASHKLLGYKRYYWVCADCWKRLDYGTYLRTWHE